MDTWIYAKASPAQVLAPECVSTEQRPFPTRSAVVADIDVTRRSRGVGLDPPSRHVRLFAQLLIAPSHPGSTLLRACRLLRCVESPWYPVCGEAV